MKTVWLVLSGAVALGACAAPATRISTGLQRYGLDASRADCVGTRLQGDLSLGQLRQLGRAAAAYRTGDTTPGVLTVGDLLRVCRRTQGSRDRAVGRQGRGGLRRPSLTLSVSPSSTSQRQDS